MSLKLSPISEQTIVITGASSGIGLATARLAAQRGAKVVLAARDGEALARICAEINERGGEAIYVVADVSDEQQVDAVAEKAISHFGGFDTWVNNAGVGVISTVEATSSEDHRRIFDVNYFGVVYGSLAAVRHFHASGKPSALINLGSAVSDIAEALSVAYSASKHAIKGFTDGLRIELMQEKAPISVTLVKPSGIDSRFFDHAKTNMGGMGKAPGPNYAPEVVAEAIIYAAQHPKRDIAVGQSAAATPLSALAPWVVDGLQKSWSYDTLIDYGHMPEDENLYHAPSEGQERSRFGHGRSWSLTTAAQMNSTLAMGIIALAGVATILAVGASRR